MKANAPSRTARAVAAYRLTGDRRVAMYGDPDADDRLSRAVAGGLDVDPDNRIVRYIHGRTKFFDAAVCNGIDRGVTQIAIIGAGYDGRALRYAAPSVRWFEVDHPATQVDKQKLLARLDVDASNIGFVAADFAVDDVAAGLVDAGFDPDTESLFICEGVASYLTPKTLSTLLRQLRSLASPRTRLALSARIPGMDAERRAQFNQRVASVGEPILLGDTDVAGLLAEARWRSVELPERAVRIGAIVGVPSQRPGSPQSTSVVMRYLERTFHRDVDGLDGHLESEYSVAVTETTQLDVGVVRAKRADGSAWVARIFPTGDEGAATECADTLRWLADVGFPAERLAATDSVSELAGQGVIVTQWVDGSPTKQTRDTCRRLGEMLGKLHLLPDAPQRIGGAWHHLASGGPADEIRALLELLDTQQRIAQHNQSGMDALRAQVRDLADALTALDLPTAFTHPDFVAANARTSPSDELIILDWAGAGIASRVWSLGFTLWAAGQTGLRHVGDVMAGYTSVIDIEPDEVNALDVHIGARPLIFEAWGYITGRQALSEIMEKRPKTRAKARAIATAARAAC